MYILEESGFITCPFLSYLGALVTSISYSTPSNTSKLNVGKSLFIKSCSLVKLGSIVLNILAQNSNHSFTSEPVNFITDTVLSYLYKLDKSLIARPPAFIST